MTNTKGYCQEKVFKKHFPEIYDEMMTISFPEDFTFPQKLYHYLHNDPELKLGVCPVCGKRCMFYRFGSGYGTYCGNRCGSLSEITKNKMKQTCQEQYGVDNYSQTDEYKVKVRQTNQERYGCDSYAQTQECQERVKQTCLKKYGTEHYSKTNESKERHRRTCQERYGCDSYSQTDECKEKIKNTFQEHYGVDNYSQTDEYKEKVLNTNQRKYGCIHYCQTHEYHKKHRKRIEYDDTFFDSSWEVEVYKFCQEHNIECVYQPSIQFEYEYGGEIRIYQPDFLINGRLYEVKGDQFFDGDKMINPYDRTQDGIYESKHQCMIDNGVIILRKEQIENLSRYIPIP